MKTKPVRCSVCSWRGRRVVPSRRWATGLCPHCGEEVLVPRYIRVDGKWTTTFVREHG